MGNPYSPLSRTSTFAPSARHHRLGSWCRGAIIAVFTVLCSTTIVNGQIGGGGLTNLRGPFIDDRLPQGFGPGGMNRGGAASGQMARGGAFFGPGVGIRNPVGRPARDALGALTSYYQSFDNGLFMTKFGADSGIGNVSLFPRVGYHGIVGNFGGSLAEGLKFGLGPLQLSNFQFGTGLFYTDYDSPVGTLDDSGWSSVLTLASQVTLTTPIVAMTSRVQAYYLPFVDEWGWGTPAPFASLGIQGMWDPGIYMLAAAKGTVGGWDLLLYDIFTGDYISNNLADAFFDEPPGMAAGANGPTQGGFDRVGRYGFGGAYLDRQADTTSRLQFPRFNNRAGSYFNADRMWFTNSAGLLAGKYLSSTLRNVTWARRDDFWTTSKFTSAGNFMTGGTFFDSAGTVYAHPYAGYEFGTFDEFKTLQHTIRAGSWGYLTDSVGYAINTGYFWTTRSSSDEGTFLADAFLLHYVGSRFMQYLGGGRGVTDPTFGERFVNDFVHYGFNYVVNQRANIQGVSGYYQTDGSLTQSSTFDAAFAGIRLRHGIGQRSFLSLSSVAERYDFQGSGQEINQWIHRAIFGFPVFRNTFGYTGYQYIDRHSNQAAASFTEHLLLFYLVCRF